MPPTATTATSATTATTAVREQARTRRGVGSDVHLRELCSTDERHLAAALGQRRDARQRVLARSRVVVRRPRLTTARAERVCRRTSPQRRPRCRCSIRAVRQRAWIVRRLRLALPRKTQAVGAGAVARTTHQRRRQYHVAPHTRAFASNVIISAQVPMRGGEALHVHNGTKAPAAATEGTAGTSTSGNSDVKENWKNNCGKEQWRRRGAQGQRAGQPLPRRHARRRR
jgi:hypothetical protein